MYTQDCCIGCSISFFCIIVLCSLIVMNCIGKSLMIFESCKGLVFTPADHFPHIHFMWHVPFAFHVLLDTTFLDATVFKRCTLRACRPFLQTSSPGSSLFRNGLGDTLWGCKWSASLPVARILPKPSKGFAKARPIIACDRCWHSRLTAFLAKGVFQIMTVAFPPGQAFNMLSVQQTIRTVWHSMMGNSATEPTSMVAAGL